MIDWFSYIILAILQGLTEFLPVSSSGHLILLHSFFPYDPGLTFDLVLHVATLVSVCIFYSQEIKSLVLGGTQDFMRWCQGKSSPSHHLRMLAYLLVATVITGCIGLALHAVVETELRKVWIVGILLIVNAGILWASRKKGLFSKCHGDVNLKVAMIIGLVQGLAVLPGISRSGSTITAALLLGVRSRDCATFSFLLSIPVILGGFLLHMLELEAFDQAHLPLYCASAVVAAAVGYGCLVFLETILKKAQFYRFAPYCLAVGLIALGCSLFHGLV